MSDIIKDLNLIRKIANKKILISLGGTFEPIDPVRGITNRSSGKMGLELAKQAYIRGADLTLLVANVSVRIPSIFNVIHVNTTAEMSNVIEEIVSDFDIFISTAAVSDFAPINKDSSKMHASSSMSLTFKPTVKIIRQIKNINPDVFLVGFKAEFNITESQIINCAKRQIKDAGTDLVVANDVGHDNCNFGSDNNEVLLIDDDIIKIPLASKKEIAYRIFDEIARKI